MPNSENLKPWKPGQSGNPGGRPKHDAITAALRDQLEASAEGKAGSIAEAIARVLIKRALRGDVRAIREIADRTEGRPGQRLNVEANARLEDAIPFDFSLLTVEQLVQLEQLLELASVPSLRTVEKQWADQSKT